MTRRVAFSEPTPPPLPPPSPQQSSWSAKYIQGNLGMVRSKKNPIPSLRNGVMVINIADGGSLSFYKVWGKNSWNGGAAANSGGNGVSMSGSATLRRLSLSSMDSGEKESAPMNESPADEEKQSIFLRQNKSRRNLMQVDDETKAKIEKVSIYVSSSEFREPPEMPYLCVPADVPWIFKSINKFKNEHFQIIVPPLPNGELDTRVRIMNFSDKVKRFMHVTTVVDGKVVTFGTVLDGSLRESRRRNNKNDDAEDLAEDLNVGDFEDTAHTEETVPDSIVSLKQTKKNTQIFTFKCPNSRDLAVYAKAAQKLDRMHTENRIKRTTTIFNTTTKRVRTAEGLEIALQTDILDRHVEKSEIVSKQITLGQKEYRCLPLYAYPYSWLTDQELVEEMARESRVWCDLREKGGNEMGCLKIEVLSCTGIPKMDAYSLSDPIVYIVCGSAAFVTDVIPDKLDAYWLPLTRRACILPIMNAYSQVHAGCFDYDGEKEMDDFIGKVVLDIPQIQAGYTYDVKLPLRDSSRVYNRSNIGFLRLRFKLEWNEGGERAALLSYVPTPDDVKKRMKNNVNAVTVKCPDAKSFYNVAHTVYGKDIPGKYSNPIRLATTRELAMINKMLIFSVKGTMKDIRMWKHPLLSGYIFCAWMHFVLANSMALVPAFLMSLILILLLRNYVKYYVKSSNGLLYGCKTISNMFRMLLFKNYSPKSRPLGQGEWKHENRPTLERFLLKLFGMSTKTIDPHQKWRYENHTEFPFSNGTAYPKITHLDARQDVLIKDDDDDVDDEFKMTEEDEKGFQEKKLLHGPSAPKLVPSTERLRRQTVISGSFLTKKSSTGGSLPGLKSSMLKSKKSADSADAATVSSAPQSKTESLETCSQGYVKQTSTESIASPARRSPAKRRNSGLKSSLKSTATRVMLTSKLKSKVASEGSNEQSHQTPTPDTTMDKFPINLPEQNVRIKGNKKSKSIEDEISEVHGKAQKATFYMFDDRAFLVEGDRLEGERTLQLHNSMNPVLRKVNPLLGGVFKVVDTAVSAFRAIFNLFMWKDPVLSFWATTFAMCSFFILLLFPWRLFFFAVGIVAVGPQNYFLADWFEKRQAAKRKRREEQAKLAKSPRRVRPVDLSASPLLMRNNTQMKPDNKSREIIIPSVPCRYNRFYDWPPDPSTTTITN